MVNTMTPTTDNSLADARDVPTLQSVEQDSVHGSAWISMRALEVLRHRAAELDSANAGDDEVRRELSELAGRLSTARTAMISIGNRVRKFQEGAADLDTREGTSLAAEMQKLAEGLLEEARNVELRAAAHAAELLAGKCVFTLSRSATVVNAILSAQPPPRVVVAESLPGGEGADVADELAEAGIDVTLVPDAVIAAVFSQAWRPPIDLMLVGADTVAANGDVVNKSGTLVGALAAQRAGVPCYATLTTDKISRDPDFAFKETGLQAPSSPGKPKRVEPVFEITPAELFTGLITEDGESRRAPSAAPTASYS